VAVGPILEPQQAEGAGGWHLRPDQFRYWLERRAEMLKRERRT
jgi:hypothetical protein